MTQGQANVIQKKRISLGNHIRRFRTVQAVYIPGARAELMRATVARRVAVDVEDEKLWLPSDFSLATRMAACALGLPEREIELRISQCHDALWTIREEEREIRRLTRRRRSEVEGQKALTRAQTVIDNAAKRCRFAMEKYRRCRRALERLDPNGSWQLTLRQLREEDVSNMLGASFDVDVLFAIGAGSDHLSWLWTNESRTGLDEDVVESKSIGMGMIGLLT